MGKRLKKAWEKAWPSAFGGPWGWIISGLGTLGMIVWAFLKNWFASPYAPLTIPIAFLFILIVFTTMNAVRKYRWGRTINYENLIMKWLYKYGYSVQKISTDKVEWAIQSTHKDTKEGFPFLVAVYKTEPDFVSIFVNFKFTPEDQGELDRITSQPNSTLLEELRIEMARLGFEYAGLHHPMGVVAIGQKMAQDDSLTELAFLQAALRVRSAHSLCLSVISKYKKLSSTVNPVNLGFC